MTIQITEVGDTVHYVESMSGIDITFSKKKNPSLYRKCRDRIKSHGKRGCVKER